MQAKNPRTALSHRDVLSPTGTLMAEMEAFSGLSEGTKSNVQQRKKQNVVAFITTRLFPDIYCDVHCVEQHSDDPYYGLARQMADDYISGMGMSRDEEVSDEDGME
eukprot:gene23438-biopygen8628